MSVESFVRVDGVETGARPPLVLIHGVGLDHAMWDPVVEALATDRRVVRYDLLGHGRSPDPAGSRSMDDFVEQCLAVMDDHVDRIPDLAGLSLGGLIALGLAARHPGRLGRLALLNTVFDRTPDQVRVVRARLARTEAEGMALVADLAIERWFASDWQVAHPERVGVVRRCMLANDVAAYLKAYRVFVDGDPTMPAAAANVTARALVMTGELDPGSTPAMSEALASVMADGVARILPGLRHLPPLEAPEAFVAALLDFLDHRDQETP